MGRIISVAQKGNFRKTDRFLHGLTEKRYARKLRHYAEKGVQVLSAATPVDSGETAASWGYEIVESEGRTAVYWTNSHVNNGVLIVMVLRYGHATRNGGFIEGNDFITPAIQPIFEEMANEAWKEVVR